ncbi:MAG: T9SS type A sorting domain-containing protein, partial [Candidatus Delongbacteria bacterium]|nr:T9SS type A sorting domain-containing protein [Candidatus Delongbacteria bacterium]
MKHISTVVFITLCLCMSAQAQVKQAHVGNDGKVFTTEIPHLQFSKHTTDKQPEPWPKSFLPDQSFKNFRGVCLEDINDDGKDEIITGIRDTIYAFSGDGTCLWKQKLSGTAIYPPSAADVDNDGDIEIFLNTGGFSGPRVYGFDHEGNILSGWPMNINDNWMICAPALANLDDDPDLEIITAERSTPGKLHVLHHDGSEMDGWPVPLDGTPATTPTVGGFSGNIGDWNNRIIMCSTSAMFVFKADGSICDGFPLVRNGVKYSYQSPLLIQSKMAEKELGFDQFYILGASHGDSASFFALDTAGNMIEGYPVMTTNNSWTYGAPSLVYQEGTTGVWLNGQPGASGDSLYPGIYYDNFMHQGFVERYDGLEGFITSTPKNTPDNFFVFTGSNLRTTDGHGFVHAYDLHSDDAGFSMEELTGYPLMVKGFTFMNGINIGNIDDDSYPELVVLSYDSNASIEDSTYINVFDFDETAYDSNYTNGTYKGSNTRSGYQFWINSNIDAHPLNKELSLYPNPTEEQIFIDGCHLKEYCIYSTDGRIVQRDVNHTGNHISIHELDNGYYILKGIASKGNRVTGR